MERRRGREEASDPEDKCSLTSCANTRRNMQGPTTHDNPPEPPPFDAAYYSELARDGSGEGTVPSKDDSWRERLSRTTRGRLRNRVENFKLILRHDHRWCGALAYDEFNLEVVFLKAPPWVVTDPGYESWKPGQQWDELDVGRLQAWLETHYDVDAKDTKLQRAVGIVAREHSFHPVRSYLDELDWDGVSRIETWLSTYLGVEDTPYTRLVGHWWLISAVARVRDPGCKADHMLVFEGAQGIGKSTALRELCPNQKWFYDSELLGLIGNKDAYVNLRGKWIIECAELDGINRKEASALKGYITGRHDSYRAPYAKTASTVARQCVLAGTINPNGLGYMRDETGARRFWPVACTKCDTEGITRDRDQLWAEADEAYRFGVLWYPNTLEQVALCRTAQAERTQQDPWQEPIAAFLDEQRKKGEVFVPTAAILNHIGVETEKQTLHSTKRVNACIVMLPGWEGGQRRRINGHKARGCEWCG